MEGIYIVIAIIIALFNFSAKQRKNQGGGQRGMTKQHKQPERPFADLEKSWNEMLGNLKEYLPESKQIEDHVEDYEGMEAEDRSRTGSLDYMELSQSSEGISSEHPESIRQITKEKRDAHKAEIYEAEEDIVFEISKESLISSVIMAEVLGPPRAIKRRIR